MTEREDGQDDSYMEEEGQPELDDRTPDEEMVTPKDSPQGVTDHGTTANEQREGESLDERIARELPDSEETVENDRPRGRLIDPESEDQQDVTSEMVAGEESGDAGALSAEEDAVHLEPE